MKKVKIYVIEDSVEYHKALKYQMEVQIAELEVEPIFIFRENAETLEQDLAAGVDIILIDDDLGDLFGDEIIRMIDSFPEHKSMPIIYYSGGESPDILQKKIAGFGGISCTTKSQLGEKLLMKCRKFILL